ncbi:YwpF-like family protein [Fredinandcohnia humi]
MKTFKLVSLMIFHHEEHPSRLEEIPLLDGLIINKEDGENRWIVEAFMEKQYKAIFEQSIQKQDTLNLQVTITQKSNDPASLVGAVKQIKEFENSVSVLVEGKLVPSRVNMAELLLTELLDKGLEGEGLLNEFKTRIQEQKQKKAVQN